MGNYIQAYSNFLGLDASSGPRDVARNRLAYSVNMWRDYESETGAAIETVPGFRRLHQHVPNATVDGENVNPFMAFAKFPSGKEYIIVDAERRLSIYPKEELLEGNITDAAQYVKLEYDIGASAAMCFVQNNTMYLNNGKIFVSIFETAEGEISVQSIKTVNNDNITENNAYIPTTYFNGEPYEQRNMLVDMAIQIETAGGIEGESIELKDENGEVYETIEMIDFPLYEKINKIRSVTLGDTSLYGESLGEVIKRLKKEDYAVYQYDSLSKNKISIPRGIVFREGEAPEKVTITVELKSLKFQTIGNMKDFRNGTGYTKTGYEAIAGCTRSAIYDGRVFLTGNPDLPNTVFYSQRNLTGANDPTYFGVYNYFNDGEGNTPNVELLATPSMLMVIKRNTVQDGSIYYHVGTDNSDEDTKHLLPRIYPSTQGAAGLGSASKIGCAGGLCCNFLDDPVFLSERGLEAVGKQTVNLERTITHRSSSIDKMLMREKLEDASICEWKGYLVICINGHIYLADSRAMTQRSDGSYQYEWFYLEGIGTYESYDDCYTVCSSWPSAFIDSNVEYVTLDKCYQGEDTVDELYCVDKDLKYDGQIFGNDKVFDATVMTANGKETTIRYVELDGEKYVVEQSRYGEKVGIGEFSPAVKVMCVDDMLFFATANGDICVFNTDKRGVNFGRSTVDPDKIDTHWYTFNGTRYLSGCSTKLDDCGKNTFAKSTICGTTVLRMKMMPGSHCFVNASEDGRVWKQIGEIGSSRFDFENFDFSNFSFTEDQGHDAVIPELSRRWYNKQYYVYSDGYMQPFGLYELSYMYRICGKIRY